MHVTKSVEIRQRIILSTLRLQLFAGTFVCGFVLFYVSLVLNFAIFKSVRI